MENDNRSSDLGGWKDGDFSTTVSLNSMAGANHDLPEHTRFLAGVVYVLRRRTAELEREQRAENDDISIFLLRPRPPRSIENAVRVPMIDNGLTRVMGRLWFMNAAVAAGHYIDLPGDTDDDRFSFVADEHQLGGHPAVVYDPRPAKAQLRLYPKGLGQPNIRELKPVRGTVSWCEVLREVERTYRECFITPGQLPSKAGLWKDAGRHRPRSNAEALIQSSLRSELIGAFPFCKILHEQPQREGRTDLEIEERDPLTGSIFVRHGVIELKVLRSYGETGRVVSDTYTAEVIKEGVRQAAAYRTGKNFRWSALCCFDMKVSDSGDDACFSHVLERAQILEVELRRWFLYSSANQFRRVTTGGDT